MRKHRSTLTFSLFENTCHLQAANTIKEQKQIKSQAPKTEIRLHLLFSNLFGTQLIFKLFHFLNEFSFMTLKNTSRGKKRAYSSYYLLVSMLKHYKEEQKAMNS